MGTTASNQAAPPTDVDFFNVRSMLSEEEQLIQDTVARFVDERVLPIIPQAFEDDRFPDELVPEIAEMGLLGCNIEGYGCAGMNEVVHGLVCQELERGDSALRSFVSVQGSLCMYPILTFGSEQQRENWLPRMATGEVLGCYGLTETEGGSDPGSMRTSAKRDGSDWILNGSKAWITTGTSADIAIVWAKTDDGIRGFIVEKGMKGFTSRDVKHKFSLRASITSELFFDDVRLPEENLLPEAKGLGAPLACLTQARYGIAWGVIGAAIACYKEALEYAKIRVVFGRPIGNTQTIQLRLADMSRRITNAQLLAMQLSKLKEQGLMHHSQVSMAKWSNTRMALEVARDARDILGASGISVEFCPIRHMLNLESVITYEGAETIHQLIVGRELCGHAAF